LQIHLYLHTFEYASICQHYIQVFAIPGAWLIVPGKAEKMKQLILLLSGFFLSILCYGQTAFEYYNIGLVKYNLRNYTEAISDFDRAVEINPEYSQAYNLRGASKYRLGDFAGAIEDYTRAIGIISRHTVGRAAGITIYDHRGKVIEPKTPAKAGHTLATAYYNRAMARNAIEDYQGALEDYSMALENDPDLSNAYYNRGHVKYLLEDREGACTDWKIAVELGLMEAYEMFRDHCGVDSRYNPPGKE
jgi:tetratricopeptide (TPR) repeat protein